MLSIRYLHACSVHIYLSYRRATQVLFRNRPCSAVEISYALVEVERATPVMLNRWSEKQHFFHNPFSDVAVLRRSRNSLKRRALNEEHVGYNLRKRS